MRQTGWLLLAPLLTGCFGTDGTADEIADVGADVASSDTSADTAIVDVGPTDGTLDTGTAPSDTSTPPVDTGTPPVDTGTPPVDTGTPPVDTGTPPVDSGTPPVDTGTPPTDTGTTDTGVTDTGAADVGPTDTAPTGALSCASADGPSSGTLVLPTEGSLDWAHWGLGGAGAWNHKSGGSVLLARGTVTGTALSYGSYPIAFSWTGGAPTATASMNDGIYFGVGGHGLAFDAAASNTTTRTIKIWTSWNLSAGTIDVSLSDASAASYSGKFSGSSGGNHPVTFTCAYRAASSGANLRIKVTHTSGFATSFFGAAVK